jgi:hypothetical protein
MTYLSDDARAIIAEIEQDCREAEAERLKVCVEDCPIFVDISLELGYREWHDEWIKTTVDREQDAEQPSWRVNGFEPPFP